jgi:hypothetical protein
MLTASQIPVEFAGGGSRLTLRDAPGSKLSVSTPGTKLRPRAPGMPAASTLNPWQERLLIRDNDISKAVRERVTPEILVEQLLDLSSNRANEPSVRLQAIIALCELGWGKPLQRVIHDNAVEHDFFALTEER